MVKQPEQQEPVREVTINIVTREQLPPAQLAAWFKLVGLWMALATEQRPQEEKAA